MTSYVRFVETGNIATGGTHVLWRISDAAGAAHPLLQLLAASGFYQVIFTSVAATTATATLGTAPSVGNLVELRVVLSVTGGSGTVIIGQSINGAAETTATTATNVSVGSYWAANILHLGGLGTSFRAFLALRDLLFYRGVHSMATMRRLAGT
jgi:hypothetical protein